MDTYKIKGRNTYGKSAYLSIERDNQNRLRITSTEDQAPIKLSKREARRFLKIMCELFKNTMQN